MWSRALPCLLLFACGTGGDDDGTTDAGSSADLGVDAGRADSGPADSGVADTGPADTGVRCNAGSAVVQVTTEDGLMLTSDHHTVDVAGAPGAVLLHMTPSFGHTRANYPQSFIDALTGRGINVLNMNRRGVDNGDPQTQQDAYLGPDGKLDAKAGVAQLTAGACGADPARIFIIGASNGTTTALDYALFAAADGATPVPAGIVFLTGGQYTENQDRIDDNRPALESQEILFVYSNVESAWSAGFLPNAPTAWTFMEYMPGDHGTNMFNVAPQAIADVADWVQARAP